MDVEVYQLIDTALKIGLGAFITGASGYLLLISSQNHEKKSALRSENVSILKDLAIKIEQARNLFDQATHPYWLKVAERDITDITDATKLALNKNKEAVAVLREVRALCALLSVENNVILLDEVDELVDNVYQKIAQTEHPLSCADELNSMMKEIDQKLIECLRNLAIRYEKA